MTSPAPTSTPAATSCSLCHQPVGDAAKVQPTTCDGQVFCPPCFATKRAPQEPKRFGVLAAVKCQFCKWISLALTNKASAACGHCKRPGALRV